MYFLVRIEWNIDSRFISIGENDENRPTAGIYHIRLSVPAVSNIMCDHSISICSRLKKKSGDSNTTKAYLISSYNSQQH